MGVCVTDLELTRKFYARHLLGKALHYCFPAEAGCLILCSRSEMATGFSTSVSMVFPCRYSRVFMLFPFRFHPVPFMILSFAWHF